MPQPGGRNHEDSLFSLELVVEKVYIPHTPCKFPAIAFRLLDYPTILIKHVEDDLGKAIRRKISFDPYFQLPDQFIELKDKDGNFMVNKGKSCLFRMSSGILKQHLANTPLYVMLIDLFPEVPKLIGNSSVPLDTIMDSISLDITKLGPTVPSVHGDKGLFKLYNLMGLEIGYFVLGFRLLCLGPTLIPHLPESVLLHRNSKKNGNNKDKNVDEMIKEHENQLGETDDSLEPKIELRNSASMTDPVKHDVLLQTIEMQDKAIHVALSGIDSQTETRPVYDKGFYSISTQTERRTNNVKQAQGVQKWVELVKDETSDYEDIIINNIDCPPPLFYNSNASPSLKICRQNLYQEHDEILVDDLSDIRSYDGEGLGKARLPMERYKQQEHSHAVHYEPEYTSPALPIRQARKGETIQGLQIAPNSNTIFPLLTALIQELSYIQNPQLLLSVSNQIQAASVRINQSDHSLKNETNQERKQKSDLMSPTVVSIVAAALTKKTESSKESKNVDTAEKALRPQHFHTSANPGSTSQGNELGKQKQSSFYPPKKIKLVYGITNTQRLRLKKTNPQWLKAVEKEVAENKKKKYPDKKQVDVDKINAPEFYDTLTEVRRLAEKELNNPASGDTLLTVTREAETFPKSTVQQRGSNKIHLTKEHSVNKEGIKPKQESKFTKSSNNRTSQNTPSPKRRLRPQQRENITNSFQQSDELKRQPVPKVRQFINSTSPLHPDQETNDVDDRPSPAPSSHSHSIDVRLPSPDIADSDDDIPLPDDSLMDKTEPQSINFPKYLSRDISLPESIDGTGNTSLNMSAGLDDNSPLESTRQSKNLASDADLKHRQSTDYDTRQFQSTDEQELQDLLSDIENPSTNDNSGRRSVASLIASQKFPIINPQLSENSPVPSVRKSTQKLDPAALSYIPSFSQRFDPSSSSSGTAKSNVTITKDFKPSPQEYDSPQQLGLKGNVFAKSKASNKQSKSPSTPRRLTPRSQKQAHGSIHTNSLSSYMPSDPDNVIISSSVSGIYSDDFQLQDIGENEEESITVETLPKFIPDSKLGYTIH